MVYSLRQSVSGLDITSISLSLLILTISFTHLFVDLHLSLALITILFLGGWGLRRQNRTQFPRRYGLGSAFWVWGGYLVLMYSYHALVSRLNLAETMVIPAFSPYVVPLVYLMLLVWKHPMLKRPGREMMSLATASLGVGMLLMIGAPFAGSLGTVAEIVGGLLDGIVHGLLGGITIWLVFAFDTQEQDSVPSAFALIGLWLLSLGLILVGRAYEESHWVLLLLFLPLGLPICVLSSTLSQRAIFVKQGWLPLGILITGSFCLYFLSFDARALDIMWTEMLNPFLNPIVFVLAGCLGLLLLTILTSAEQRALWLGGGIWILIGSIGLTLVGWIVHRDR